MKSSIVTHQRIFLQGKDKSLRDLCFSKGILLKLKGIDEIGNDIYKRFHGISRDFLNYFPV